MQHITWDSRGLLSDILMLQIQRYRKIKIMLTPGSSLGSNAGYTITIIIYKGGASLTPVTVINTFDYPLLLLHN